MSLAITSYSKVPTLTDEQHIINLSMTLDERPFLSVDLDSIILRELESEIQNELQYINRYLVKDPYGEDLLGPSVAAFYSNSKWPCSITCGAGVNSLLPSLARLAQGNVAYIIGNVLPDFPFWVAQATGNCVVGSAELDVEQHAEAAKKIGASIVFLERPSLSGDKFTDLAELQSLCDKTESNRTLVIIDESNGNYYAPSFGAANLVERSENLVVLRGLSKAYWLGGLRLAYCVSPAGLEHRIRSVIPPLLASSLSIKIGKTVLELGDITGRLRERIRKQKAEMKLLIESAEISNAVLSSEYLPYILVNNSEQYIRSRIESKGIVGKFHPVWSGDTRLPNHVYRLSAPLTSKRMSIFKERVLSPNRK